MYMFLSVILNDVLAVKFISMGTWGSSTSEYIELVYGKILVNESPTCHWFTVSIIPVLAL